MTTKHTNPDDTIGFEDILYGLIVAALISAAMGLGYYYLAVWLIGG
jgi:hypothetical protein